MFGFNRFLKSCLAVILALIPLTAFADMALLMKEENSGFVPNYLFRQMSCRIEATRVTKVTNVGFFSRREVFDIRLEDRDNFRHLLLDAQRAGITDSGPAPTDVPTVTWSASLNSEGDLKLGGIENGRFFYNESEAANALRFMIDSLCGTMPESVNLIK